MNLTLTGFQKATLEAPWPWVAGRLAANDGLVAEPLWDGVRVRITREASGWKMVDAEGRDLSSHVADWPAHPDVVLEGVMLAKQGALWLTKREAVSALAGDIEAHLVCAVTDCLHYDAESVAARSYAVRRVYARKSVEALPTGRALLTPYYRLVDKASFAKAATWRPDGVTAATGVLVKRLAAPYDPTDTESWRTAGPPPSRLPVAETVPRRVLKAESAQQKVWGVVFEPETEDTQGDVISVEEIEKACHQFGADYRAGRTELWLQHDRKLTDRDAILLENYIAPQDLILGDQAVRKGSWLQVWHLKADVLWNAVLDGTFTGFSFGGSGLRGMLAKRAVDSGTYERDADGLVVAVRTGDYVIRFERDIFKRVVGWTREPA